MCVYVCVTESHCCTAVIDTTLKFNCALIKKKKLVSDFPGGSVNGNLPGNAGDTGLIPGPGGVHMPWNN